MADPNQGAANLVSQLKAGVTNISSIAQTLANVFPRLGGSFTLSAATTTLVPQPGILANGIPLPFASNTSALALVKNSGIYLSGVTPGTGFSISTGTGLAAGTEQFVYIVFNLV